MDAEYEDHTTVSVDRTWKDNEKCICNTFNFTNKQSTEIKLYTIKISISDK